ncbi:hypothetical protein SAMN05216428_101497 [Nitrosospira sp. Nsp11]|nr:hypothetical protein SAMN05216428_101497 [Nitrosospira sp. Nsp11]
MVSTASPQLAKGRRPRYGFPDNPHPRVFYCLGTSVAKARRQEDIRNEN